MHCCIFAKQVALRKHSVKYCLVAFFLVTILPLFVRAEGLDIVTMKDGSVLYGEVVSMVGGNLKVKTGFGSEEVIRVKWAEVMTLTTTRPLPFELKEGTMIKGMAQEGDPGSLQLTAEPLSTPVQIPLDSVTAINPPLKRAVNYVGDVTAGLATTSGNTNIDNISFLGTLEARSKTLRLTLYGRYVLSEQDDTLTARNARGTIKLDFFLTKRFYLFTTAFFEQDTFQDLQLRTALSGGPGYQFIEKGDFSSPQLREMQMYAEAGASYFNEDFKLAPDQSSARARLALKLDWPIIKKTIVLYHYGEAFPSFDDTDDYYLTADQGIMFKVWNGLVTKFQFTWRYNNKPAPGTKNNDTLFLFTFGYHFDTTNNG